MMAEENEQAPNMTDYEVSKTYSNDTSIRRTTDPETAKLQAVLILQSYWRRMLARRELDRRKAEKKNYEALMEELERNAYLQMVQSYRAEQERKRQLEKEEERRQQIVRIRKKKMLESAYEGRTLDLKALLQEVSDEDDSNHVDHDVIGRAIRLKHKMELIECEDANKNSVLSEACSKVSVKLDHLFAILVGGNLETVKFLLDNGAYVNSRGQFGRTPLYRASFGGHLDIVQLLLQHGADPRLYADDGQRPVEVAMNDTIRDLIDSWAIEDTERLVRQISIYQHQLAEQYDKGNEAILANLQLQVDKADKNYQVAQCKLCKAHDQLNKRIAEYDRAELSGFQNMDLLKQAIHDAEFYLESIKLEVDKTRQKLQEAKLNLRDKQTEVKGRNNGDTKPGIQCSVRDLDDVLFKDVGNRLTSSGKWPFVIDPSDQASTFLRYRDTNYVNVLNPKQMQSEKIRIGLVGALRYGKPFVLDLLGIDKMFDTVCRACFDEIRPSLTEDIIDKKILEPSVYETLVKDEDGEDLSVSHFMQRNLDRFLFVVVTKNPFPDNELLDYFEPVWVE